MESYLGCGAVGGARPAGYRADDTTSFSARSSDFVVTDLPALIDIDTDWRAISAARSVRSSKSWVWRAAIWKTGQPEALRPSGQ